MRKLLAETIGTFALVFAGTGAIIIDEISGGKVTHVGVALTFGMIVTAEPYYAVTQPSDVVVMENVVRQDTRGVIETINARYELLPRGTYTNMGRAAGFRADSAGRRRSWRWCGSGSWRWRHCRR